MMIEPVWKEEIRCCQEIELASPEHVLCFHAFSAHHPVAARHDVGDSVQAHQAALTSPSETVRASRAMQLGTARQHQAIGAEQRMSERLLTFCADCVAIVQDLHGMGEGTQARRHGEPGKVDP